MNHQKMLVLDFGGQYSQLIARRVRDLNVYAEIKPYTASSQEIKKAGYIGIILTGGPKSVYADGSPVCSPEIFDLDIPVLGICYGAQLMAHLLGGKVQSAPTSEYGKTSLHIIGESPVLFGISKETDVWMSHTDYIAGLPENFVTDAATDGCPNAAISYESKNLYAVQFHPEVQHTAEGQRILRNFVCTICGAQGDWTMRSFVDEKINQIKEKVGEKRVLCALSGGVDSSVSAVMISKAVGRQLTCIFVDHGLMRKNEGDEVEAVFGKQFDLDFIRVNAQDRFLSKLSGIYDPEKKRKIIGEEFIRVFEEESKKIGSVDFLAQGTIYPDVVESGEGDAANIKSHHNVGGLPEHIDFEEIIEPLRELFKDEVRQAGIELGIPENLVWRQPFPGPGLGVRVLGQVSKEKLDILREADSIFRQEMEDAGLAHELSQYFAILTDASSVGVKGDARTYGNVIALRAVKTSDFMTADWVKIPYDALEKASSRIVNEIKDVSRVVYDITSKPPATIEWE